MPDGGKWSGNMKQAWQWTGRALELGMSATAGLADYRAGGGHVGTGDWRYMYRLAKDAADTGALIQGQPWETPLPSDAYTVVDLSYGQRYWTTATIGYVDAATGKGVERTITVESDRTQTWEEIEDDILEAGNKYGVQGGEAGIEVWGTKHFQRLYVPGAMARLG